MTHRLYIRNMVCDRCRLVVTDLLHREGLHPLRVDLGEVELERAPDAATLVRLQRALEGVGFALINDRTTRTIDRVKRAVQDYVATDHAAGRPPRFSTYLTDRVPKDYAALSTLFSSVEGITLQQYLIRVRIEKAKELLVYDELSLTQIADRLGYSSVPHLSQQFRAVTGLTPTHFRRLGAARRKGLDRA